MALKFADNLSLTVRFPFGDFKEVDGAYGPQYLYTVEVEGERDRLYAAPALHEALQAAGVGPDALFTITKVEGEDRRKHWQVTPAPEAAAAPPGANGRPDSPAGAPERVPPARPGFADLQTLLADCLHTAWQTWQGLEVYLSFCKMDGSLPVGVGWG